MESCAAIFLVYQHEWESWDLRLDIARQGTVVAWKRDVIFTSFRPASLAREGWRAEKSSIATTPSIIQFITCGLILLESCEILL
jgi:hypothetical protein